ncbi:MAG TPA: CRISPR-associated endonuclease Cas2 [Longimicrobiales bacterium]
MTRRHYLVSYDISDDRRRNAVFKILEGQGDHVQFSVFVCEFNERELAEVRARLRREINTIEDQVLIVDLGPAATPLEHGIECLGRPYAPSVRTLVV